MKKQNLLDNLLSGLRTAVQYWSDHAASHQAMEQVYIRKWREEEPIADYATQILINPYGSIYKVTHRYFANGDLIREETYLATYGWQCNGHLIALGSHRWLVFNPEQRQLILEDWPDPGDLTTEIFEQL
jgi:hypothetical protein